MRLRIVLESPPSGVDFGLQNGRGVGYKTVDTQRSSGGNLTFELGVEARMVPDQQAPDFGGPMVQGPRGGRFIYVDIGTLAGQTNTACSRRLKVPLSGISWRQIDRGSDGSVLETRLPGTGSDGWPTCGTPKPFPGWRAAASRGR